MKAHDVAFQLIQKWAQDARPISENDLKSLNKVLLVRPYWRDAITPDGSKTRREILVGDYKKYPNSVRLENGEIFEYTTPIETPPKMQELMEWFRSEEELSRAHPLVLAALFHYKFVRIHPFDDGNGRVSRLLMNYVLLRNNFPPIIIKSADKNNYLKALNSADAGDTEAFVRYVGEQLIWSLDISIKAAKGEDIEEPDDIDKELSLLQKQINLNITIQERKSPENIVAIFELSLIKIFELTESKLQQLADSFIELERNFIPIIPEGYNHLDSIQDKDWTSLKRWLINEIVIGKKQIIGFNYTYNLNGLKSAIKAPRFQASVVVEFNDFNYSINKVLFPYGQPLSEEEIQSIVRPIIKEVIEKIKLTTQP
jgi:fido (protein-threonine AMPylation protein)